MKERPIRLIAPKVRALLNGTKTQDRWVVKPQPARGQGMVNAGYCGDRHLWLRDGPCSETDPAKEWRCPFGKPGERLWVQEAWRTVEEADYTPPSELSPAHRIWYEADASHQPGSGKLRPGIRMPRWASRITLEITGVRVERLQDISEADAMAEGVGVCAAQSFARVEGVTRPAGFAYRDLWQSFNGPDSWATNPWAWAVEFKRVEGDAS
jgi:hypothetical protein